MSFTVTVKEHFAVFPEASVAVNTLVVEPTGKTEPLCKPLVKATVALQLSVAVTSNVAFAPQTPKSVLILRGVGHVITGNSLSFTVTVKEHFAVFPEASVAVKTFVVEPTGKTEPLCNPLVKATVALQLSIAVTSNVAFAPQTPKLVLILRGVGQVMTGNSLSVTLTVKEQVAVLPDASVAVNTFVVDPTGKIEPLCNPLVKATDALQLSVAVTSNVAFAPQTPKSV